MAASEDNAPRDLCQELTESLVRARVERELSSRVMLACRAALPELTPAGARRLYGGLFDAGLLRTGRHAEVLRQLDRAESRYNTLREALEELCAGSEPMILAWEDPANPIAAPVECVAVIDLRALLSKDGNDGT